MIRHELYKTFVNKTTILFIMALLIINAVQLVYVEGKGRSWSAAAYNEVWADADRLIKDNAGDIRNSFETWILDCIMHADSCRYTDNPYTEMKLLLRVQTEAESAFGYNEYLADVEKTARRYEKLAVFADGKSYAHRDMEKMRKAYGNISCKNLIPAASAGVRMASRSDVTDVLAVVFLLYICTSVWLREREHNIILLIRTTYMGRGGLAAAKLMVLVMSCVFLGMALYGTNMITAGIMYGLGDLNRPLASVYEYSHTLWEISAGEFLALNILVKIPAYILIMLLISMICLVFNYTVAVFLCISAVSAAGCLMYYKIPDLSVWSAFKYLNPFAVLKTEKLFEGYKSVNILGYPSGLSYCLAGLFITGCLAFGIISVKCFLGYTIKGKKRVFRPAERAGRFLNSLTRRTAMHTDMLLHDIYRIFISCRTWIVVLLLMSMIIYEYNSFEVIYPVFKDYYIEQYLTGLQGPVTEEKTDFIVQELKRVSRMPDDDGNARKEAMREISEYAAYLGGQEGAYFIYYVPHNILTAGNGGNSGDLLRAVMCLIPISIIMPCFFAPDLQNNILRITDTTCLGKKRLKTVRYITAAIVSFLIAATVHLTHFVLIMTSYDVDPEVLSYPVNSLSHLSAFGDRISIGTYYVLIYTVKILATAAGAFLICRISCIIKSQANTTLASVMFLVVPLLTALYDRRIIHAAYPYSAMLGNLFIQNRAAMAVCITTVLCVCAVVFILNRYIKCKK